HRLDHGQRLAGLDLLPFGHGDRDDEAGHRAQQLLAAVAGGDDRHQPHRSGFGFGVDVDWRFDALMREPYTVRDRPRLDRDFGAVDGAVPNRIARLPVGGQLMRRADLAVGADEADRDRAVVPGNIQQDLVTPEPHRAAALTFHRPADHLLRDL